MVKRSAAMFSLGMAALRLAMEPEWLDASEHYRPTDGTQPAVLVRMRHSVPPPVM